MWSIVFLERSKTEQCAWKIIIACRPTPLTEKCWIFYDLWFDNWFNGQPEEWFSSGESEIRNSKTRVIEWAWRKFSGRVICVQAVNRKMIAHHEICADTGNNKAAGKNNCLLGAFEFCCSFIEGLPLPCQIYVTMRLRFEAGHEPVCMVHGAHMAHVANFPWDEEGPISGRASLQIKRRKPNTQDFFHALAISHSHW